MRITKFLFFLTLCFSQAYVYAQNAKYCVAEGKKIDFHLFGFTYESELLKKNCQKSYHGYKSKI